MKFRVNIDSALAVLKKNLDEHIEELKEAQATWTAKAIEGLEKLRDAVDRKGLDASYVEVNSLFHQKPQDNRKNYSKFMGALEVAKTSGETHIELDEDDYDKMFNDNWDWRKMSKSLNATYTKPK